MTEPSSSRFGFLPPSADEAAGDSFMNVSLSAALYSQVSGSQSPAPAPKPSASSASSTPQDTVSFKSTAPQAPAAGDVDHDGDSH
jgi:hypothetical protein